MKKSWDSLKAWSWKSYLALLIREEKLGLLKSFVLEILAERF
jgi:hypothetical protein